MPRIILDVKLYSIKEVSQLLGVTYQTTQKYISDNKIEAQIIGGRKYVSEEKLKSFLLGSKQNHI